jgi:hypothetical protein
MATVIPIEQIERQIILIRGHKVLLDAHLAALYGVTTKRLNEQVGRNRSRFPADFMLQLSSEEVESLRSQFATSNQGRGGRRYAPYAFTEQGVAMLSTVLNSERAIRVNIEIMRAFVRLRGMILSNKDLARELDALERKFESHDAQIRSLFQAIRQLGTTGGQEEEDRIYRRGEIGPLWKTMTGAAKRLERLQRVLVQEQ